MRKKEQRLWDRFRANVGRRVLLKRVENGVESGMPDVVALAAGAVSWIELKAVEGLPRRAETPLLGSSERLTVEQRNWHAEWTRHGGCTYVLVGVGDGQLLLPGRFADRVNEMSFQDAAAASLAEEWAEITAALENSE